MKLSLSLLAIVAAVSLSIETAFAQTPFIGPSAVPTTVASTVQPTGISIRMALSWSQRQAGVWLPATSS